MSPTNIGDGDLMKRTSGEYISRFVETLTEEENALHFPELRRYNNKQIVLAGRFYFVDEWRKGGVGKPEK